MTENGSIRPQFDRPVIIVAAPRSGSTLLFETLAVNRHFWSIGDESHRHFERIASLRPNMENPSNCLTAQQATQQVRESLLNSFTADLINADGKHFCRLPGTVRPDKIRFLEKTPKNSLRIPFLLEVFPDVRFIYLFRDARQNMSSLLESWRSGRYVTYPRLPGWPADMPWSHLLIPDWQKLVGGTLAEVVAQQWLVTNQTILDDLQKLPAHRWCSLEYDTLLNDTDGQLKRLCRFAEVGFDSRMQKLAEKPLQPSKYTVSMPQKDKWKRSEEELQGVTGSTRELMEQLRAVADNGAP